MKNHSITHCFSLILTLVTVLVLCVCCGWNSTYCHTWSAEEIFKTWNYSHQDTSTVYLAYMQEDTLCIKTRANTFDRIKMSNEVIYTTGTYKWKTYIPVFNPGDMTSVGSWIYCDDHHEVDFEVGYGTPEAREEAGCKEGEVVACMTNQDFPFTSSYVPILPGWHEFSIRLDVIDGCYDIHWLIDGVERKNQKVGFGPEVAFRIFVSVENLKFIGSHIATKDNVGRYEWVSFTGETTDI